MSSKVFLFLIVIFSQSSKVLCNEINENHKNTEVIKFHLVYPNDNASEYVQLLNESRIMYHMKGKTEISMECMSKSPIKIIFSGVMAHDIKYTQMDWNQTTEFYRVSIGFENTPAATGSYSCVTIGNATYKANKAENATFNSTIYVFADNSADIFLLNWKKTDDSSELEIRTTEENVLIPCITFRPDVQPILRTSNFSVVPKETYRHDNTKGFYVNLTNNTMNMNYECSLPNSPNSPILKFKLPELNCTFSGKLNENNEIYWSDQVVMSIKCESLERIKIIKNNDEQLAASTNYKHFYYKYVAVAELKSIFLLSYITCNTNNNNIVLKKWTFLFESPTFRKIKYNGPQNVFYCNGSSHDYEITMSLVNCINLINCDTARRFHPSTINIPGYSYPYSFNKYSNLAGADLKQLLGIDKKETCALISPKPDVKQGIAYCMFKKHDSNSVVTVTLQYFVGLSGEIVEELDYKNVSDVLRILPLFSNKNETQHFHRGAFVNFVCEASVPIFAKAMELNFIFSNGSRQAFSDPFGRNVRESDDRYQITEKIKIWSENITGVECQAFSWNKMEWIKVSHKFAVTVESEMPKVSFDDYPIENTTVNIEVNDDHVDKNITCKATGSPAPTITWIRLDWEGTTLPNSFNTTFENVSEYARSSTIIFPKTLREAYYKFVCSAKNPVGERNKTIIITRKSDTGIERWIFYTIAAMVLFLSGIVLFLCRMLKSKQNQIELSEAEIANFMDGDEDLVTKYEELHEVAQYLPYKQQYEIHPSKIEIKNDVLGTGNSGIVLKGIFEKSGKSIPVAVKTVKPSSDIFHLRTLLSEIKIMMYIGKHPYIIEMLGAMTKDLREGKLSVAFAFCSNGDLQSYLRLCRPVFLDQNVDEGTKFKKSMKSSSRIRRFRSVKAIDKRQTKYPCIPHPIKTTNLITWCYQVASGMEYLTSKKVIHGDLAARNLLITDNLSVKITDFGLARHLYDYTNYVTKQKSEPLPWRWLSIEAIQDSKFSTQSDVWAYAVTLWEIFSLGEVPYQGFSWGQEFVQDLSKGYRMGKPQYATEDIYNTMLECWNTMAADRPSFQDISKNFKELLETMDVCVEDMDATNALQTPACPSLDILVCG